MQVTYDLLHTHLAVIGCRGDAKGVAVPLHRRCRVDVDRLPCGYCTDYQIALLHAGYHTNIFSGVDGCHQGRHVFVSRCHRVAIDFQWPSEVDLLSRHADVIENSSAHTCLRCKAIAHCHNAAGAKTRAWGQNYVT